MSALRLAGPVALAVSLAIPGSSVPAQQPGRVVQERTLYDDLQLFTQVFNQIRVNHPDSPNAHALVLAAVQGMLRAADPHSYVLVRQRLDPAKEKQLREGKLVPVPIQFDYDGDRPVTVGVAPQSRAARLGLFPGDRLLSIDGRPILAENALELELTLAGPRGTTVNLGFQRRRTDGTDTLFAVRVARERVSPEGDVPVVIMKDAQTGYVRLAAFSSDKTADELRDALGRLERQGMRRLVLDLRDNGGGLLKEAADAAGAFLPRGTVVYTTEGRKSDVAATGKVSRFFGSEKRYPIVVLVNRGTASAAELLAGTLQDHDRALVVGQPTFGKALVMNTFPLADGSAVVMVIGHVRTPCGRVIQRSYQGMRRRDFFDAAGAQSDTAGRQTCRTPGGRVLYGGGGIYPDVIVPESTLLPPWLSRARERGVLRDWIGGHLSANAAAYSSIDALAAAPSIAGDGLASFRRFAVERGITPPEGAEADAVLTSALLAEITSAKWGDAGRFRFAALVDPEIDAAVATFSRAEAIIAGSEAP